MSPKAAGRQPPSRVSSAGNPSSPAATVRSTSPDRGRGANALRTDSRVLLSERPKGTAHFQEPRGSDRGREDEQSSGGHAEERSFEPKLSGKKGRSPTDVKLGNYDGNTCQQTVLARFENCAEYFDWDEADKLFQLLASLTGAAGQILWVAGKQSTVGQIVALLMARFGCENQAERYRAEQRCRKRSKGDSFQKLYQDVRHLMSLAYHGESSALSDIVGRDAFLEALDDQTLRVRILEKEPKNVDEALNIASRLEAFHVMGAAGPEGEKNKVKYARAAAGGKECTGSEGTRVPAEITKQIEYLKALVSSYRRELDKQQQEISVLRRGL